jgi:hypothetical protein
MTNKPLMLIGRAGPYVLLALPAGTASSPQVLAAFMTPRIDPDSLSYTIPCVPRSPPSGGDRYHPADGCGRGAPPVTLVHAAPRHIGPPAPHLGRADTRGRIVGREGDSL